MKAESTAVASANLEERQAVRAKTDRQQTETGPAEGVSGLEKFIATILDNLKLLLLGPLVAGLAMFGIASLLPKSYTSVVYLNLDETGARVADARMRSIPILDNVLVNFKAPRDTLEARRRLIEENRRIVVAPGETQKTSSLFRMEYTDGDPHVAQKVNTLLLEAWLESTKPAPDRRAAIEAEIDRTTTQTKSISLLVERLEKDAPSLVAQSLQGELATPILGLITKRDQNLASLAAMKNSLNGVSRDVIFGAPDLPEEPSWPKRGIITILAAAVTGLLLLMYVILRAFGPRFRFTET
jgi:hypothetical protein